KIPFSVVNTIWSYKLIVGGCVPSVQISKGCGCENGLISSKNVNSIVDSLSVQSDKAARASTLYVNPKVTQPKRGLFCTKLSYISRRLIVESKGPDNCPVGSSSHIQTPSKSSPYKY